MAMRVRRWEARSARSDLKMSRIFERQQAPNFELYDGRCRHVLRSVQAGATGAVAVPLWILPADLPDRGDLVGVQHTIDRTQAEIDAAPNPAAQVALLTKALLVGTLD